MKPYVTVFVSVFLAEVGDKTQLATLFFAASPLVKGSGVFLAAAGALVLSTAIAVTVGGAVGHWLSPRVVKTLAGVGFILIGALMLVDRS